MFADRSDAGRQLAKYLSDLRGEPDLIVVGLPRGGVPVAAEVATALGAPLDVIVVRKLGVPGQPELAMGAIGEGGIRVINNRVVATTGVSEDDIGKVEATERAELNRRAKRFRRKHHRISLTDKTVLVVDDGIATGSTARAACQVARAACARRVILAVPVTPVGWQTRLKDVADELIAFTTPRQFRAVGQYYDDFEQTSDDEVVELLNRATARADDRS